MSKCANVAMYQYENVTICECENMEIIPSFMNFTK